jgi:hypothetical protein
MVLERKNAGNCGCKRFMCIYIVVTFTSLVDSLLEDDNGEDV